MLRTMFKGDLQRLVAIEAAAHATPWTEETFKACFEAGYTGWVIERDEQVIGFVMVSVRLGECHILNLCVDRTYQRQGMGRQLLRQALDNARQQGCAVAYLEVRRSNTRAIALYQKERFRLIGMRKEYYVTVNGKEDALVLARSLEE